MWAQHSKRQLLEHYTDAVRQERLRVMYAQALLGRKILEPEDWDWLDRHEDRYWGGELSSSSEEAPEGTKCVRELLAEARARPVTEEDRQRLQEWFAAGCPQPPEATTN